MAAQRTQRFAAHPLIVAAAMGLVAPALLSSMDEEEARKAPADRAGLADADGIDAEPADLSDADMEAALEAEFEAQFSTLHTDFASLSASAATPFAPAAPAVDADDFARIEREWVEARNLF